MELSDIFTNVELLKNLLSLLAVLVLSGLGVLAIKYGFGKPFGQAVIWLIENKDKLRRKVDEEADNINQRLEAMTGIPALTWSKVMPLLVDAMVSGAEAVPLGEKDTA